MLWYTILAGQQAISFRTAQRSFSTHQREAGYWLAQFDIEGPCGEKQQWGGESLEPKKMNFQFWCHNHFHPPPPYRCLLLMIQRLWHISSPPQFGVHWWKPVFLWRTSKCKCECAFFKYFLSIFSLCEFFYFLLNCLQHVKSGKYHPKKRDWYHFFWQS